jgi:DNA repair protein RecO (recombination protein O)
MEATRNTLALILRRSPYRESDLLITAYTKDFGKQVMVARGAKKAGSKLAGHLEPLTLAEIMIIYGRGRNYAGGANAVSTYPGLRGDLNKLYFAGKAIGWFDRLVKDDEPDARLFLLITKWLEALSRLGGKKAMSRESGELLFAFLAWKLMAELGYGPQLSNCAVCHKPLKPSGPGAKTGRAKGNHFDFKQGGVVGAECAGDDRENQTLISDECLKTIRFILKNRWEQFKKLKIKKKTVKELAKITDGFIKYHTP